VDRRTRRPGRPTLTIAAVVSVLLTGCSDDRGPSPAVPDASPIAQPAVGGLDVAPRDDRVDLEMPEFSDPTTITNPYFPVSSQRSVLLLGRVDGELFRTEVTLLPETRIIEWDGQRVETLVSQYVAFLDGRIHEVAYDYYAQADDGSVWYFGEDVFNFADGSIVDTHGTWIAGRDGPAAMIMPGHPQVGDVYRPENIPGFVFEEVTVRTVDRPLEGPLGTIGGGLIVRELHMDGGLEVKAFAPGYGEFLTAGGGDVEALALAVPTDATEGPVPPELTTIVGGSVEAFDAASSGDLARATAAAETVATAWDVYALGDVPARIEPRMDRAVRSLGAAGSDEVALAQAAIDVARLGMDLQLRYRPVVEVDVARFDLWLAQLILDAERGDASAVNGDFFALDYVRDRILAAVEPSTMSEFNARLEELLGAITDGDLAGAALIAEGIRSMVS
jgi:hypothetical protein